MIPAFLPESREVFPVDLRNSDVNSSFFHASIYAIPFPRAVIFFTVIFLFRLGN